MVKGGVVAPSELIGVDGQRGGQREETGVRVLRAIAVGLGVVLAFLTAWVVVARFRHPIDGEWMTGAIRDGVERVRDGRGLYVAPSAEFIPFVYPPVYFVIAAALAKVMPTFIACKVVSIGATACAAWAIARIARALGASSFWQAGALLLHLATYSLTLAFYDLERVDALYAAVFLVALAVLFTRTTTLGAAVSGALFGLSFFTKQAGLLAFLSVLVGLALAGERRRAMVFGAAGCLVLAALGGYLEIATDGWFRYYCLTLPSAHGIRAERVSIFFVQDLPKAFAIAAGSIAVSVPVLASLVRRRRLPVGASWQDLVLASAVLASMVASFSFRAHSGGWANVLVAWLPLGCAATAVAASRAEQAAAGTRAAPVVTALVLAGLALQLAGAIFDPTELAPDRDDVAERRRFFALVRQLERQGQVLVTTTGDVTRPATSAHAAALYDVIRAGDRAPADLREGLEARRYAALFLGNPDETDCGTSACDELTSLVARFYFVAGRRHERDRNGMTGYDARPRWLLRPRQRPLSGELTKPQLLRRQEIEKGFAVMKSALVPAPREIAPSDDIEDLTDREIAARASP
ncbi:MAG: hypothetical protein JWP97_1388 [Labilithrix sp.]|nr:hypothetical protein [Labilithrix sp.]